MASVPFMPFWRPLPLPRVASIRFLKCRFSTQHHLSHDASTDSSKAVTSPPPPPPPASSITAPPLATNSPSPSPLAYHVHRTASQLLPVYHLAKRGGNLRQTRIRKIEGDVELLRNEIRTKLGLKEHLVVINRLTGHVIIKGWYRDLIKQFLEARHF